jgi:hypothetical protein
MQTIDELEELGYVCDESGCVLVLPGMDEESDGAFVGGAMCSPRARPPTKSRLAQSQSTLRTLLKKAMLLRLGRLGHCRLGCNVGCTFGFCAPADAGDDARRRHCKQHSIKQTKQTNKTKQARPRRSTACCRAPTGASA